MASSHTPSLAECVPPHHAERAGSRSSSEFSLLGEDCSGDELQPTVEPTVGLGALQALVEGGAYGVFRWIESSGGPSQAIKVCMEQLVSPSAPEAVKRSAADVLACVCMGRHPQCALTLMDSDVQDILSQLLKIAACSDARIVRRSTQLCLVQLLCSLHQEQGTREAVFTRPERASAVLSLCLRLVPSRHLRSASEAVQCLLQPLLPLVVAQGRVPEAARAIVDLLKHCVEAGCCSAEGGWTLSELSSSSLDAGAASEQQRQQQGGDQAQPAAHALLPVTALSAAHAASAASSSSVAMSACRALHSLLACDAPGAADAAAHAVMAEKGIAPLVALLEESVGTAESQRSAASGDAHTAPPASADGAVGVEGQQQQLSTSTDGSGAVAELGAAALDCLARMLQLCAEEGAPAQAISACGVRALLRFLQLPHATPQSEHTHAGLARTALHTLCQLMGEPEGQQALLNLGGLPVLAAWAEHQPSPVLCALFQMCASVPERQRAVAQSQPVLSALVAAMAEPATRLPAMTSLLSVLDSLASTASQDALAADADAAATAVLGDALSSDASSKHDTSASPAHTLCVQAALGPAATRLAEAGAITQLDALLPSLLSAPHETREPAAVHAAFFSSTRHAALRLLCKLAAHSPDACDALLCLYQQQQSEGGNSSGVCGGGALHAAASLLCSTACPPAHQAAAAELLLHLIQHCHASAHSTASSSGKACVPTDDAGAQEQRTVCDGVNTQWVAWAAGSLLAALPADAAGTREQQQQQRSATEHSHSGGGVEAEHACTADAPAVRAVNVAALEGLALALRMLPLDAAARVFGEAGLGLRQLRHLSNSLACPAATRALAAAHHLVCESAAGTPPQPQPYACVAVLSCALEVAGLPSKRAWGCQLLCETAPGISGALELSASPSAAAAPSQSSAATAVAATDAAALPLPSLLGLGLQALERACCLCTAARPDSTNSSSSAEESHASAANPADARPPHCAALALCNALLAAVCAPIPQLRQWQPHQQQQKLQQWQYVECLQQQQAHAVARVCECLRQCLLREPGAWQAVTSTEEGAAELVAESQRRLRAVVHALSQEEEECAHFKLLAAAAIALADLSAKQAQHATEVLQQAKQGRLQAEEVESRAGGNGTEARVKIPQKEAPSTGKLSDAARTQEGSHQSSARQLGNPSADQKPWLHALLQQPPVAAATAAAQQQQQQQQQEQQQAEGEKEERVEEKAKGEEKKSKQQQQQQQQQAEGEKGEGGDKMDEEKENSEEKKKGEEKKKDKQQQWQWTFVSSEDLQPGQHEADGCGSDQERVRALHLEQQRLAALESELRQEIQEASVPQQPSLDALRCLSAKELKSMVQQRGLECRALEKEELAQALVNDGKHKAAHVAVYHKQLTQRLQQVVLEQRRAKRAATALEYLLSKSAKSEGESQGAGLAAGFGARAMNKAATREERRARKVDKRGRAGSSAGDEETHQSGSSQSEQEGGRKGHQWAGGSWEGGWAGADGIGVAAAAAAAVCGDAGARGMAGEEGEKGSGGCGVAVDVCGEEQAGELAGSEGDAHAEQQQQQGQGQQGQQEREREQRQKQEQQQRLRRQRAQQRERLEQQRAQQQERLEQQRQELQKRLEQQRQQQLHRMEQQRAQQQKRQQEMQRQQQRRRQQQRFQQQQHRRPCDWAGDHWEGAGGFPAWGNVLFGAPYPDRDFMSDVAGGFAEGLSDFAQEMAQASSQFCRSFRM